MKILVIEDDQVMSETIKSSLIAQAHTVDVANDGADGSFLARSYDFDAILLDYNLPKKDGLTVCKEIRSTGKATPILFMSVAGDTSTKVSALRLGADDYVTKPFALDEMLARIDAISRRAPRIREESLAVGDITLEPHTHAVTRGGTPIQLTRKEFQMLEYFMKNPGMIISRAQIMEHIWTADGNPFSNTIEAHIRNLRKKLNFGGLPDVIVNIPGRGYMLQVPK